MDERFLRNEMLKVLEKNRKALGKKDEREDKNR